MSGLKYKLAPQMLDAERQPYEWLPFLMRRASPNYRSASLATDAQGLRVTFAGNQAVDFDAWASRLVPRAAITGNSSLFGVGTSSDRRTAASLLNDHGARGLLWYNLAQRASNIVQERLALEFFAPFDLECLVWISGLNDLIAMILGEGGSRNILPFIGEPAYLKAMGQARPPAPASAEERYRQMIGGIDREFRIIRSLFSRTQILFALQPALAWCDKPPHANEASLTGIFDAATNRLHRAHSPALLQPWQSRYAADLAAAARSAGLDFLDLNQDPAFRSGEWMFIDRIHLTDRGHERIADVVAAWLEAQAT